VIGRSIIMQTPSQCRIHASVEPDIAAAAQPAGSGRHARVEGAPRVHSFARAPHLPPRATSDEDGKEGNCDHQQQC